MYLHNFLCDVSYILWEPTLLYAFLSSLEHCFLSYRPIWHLWLIFLLEAPLTPGCHSFLLLPFILLLKHLQNKLGHLHEKIMQIKNSNLHDCQLHFAHKFYLNFWIYVFSHLQNMDLTCHLMLCLQKMMMWVITLHLE